MAEATSSHNKRPTLSVTSVTANVGQDSLDLNGNYAALQDLLLACDSEIEFARQKHVTSGYLSGDYAAVVNGFDAEIRRLIEQTAKLERQLTHLGRGDDSTGDQLVSGSRISSRDTSPDAAVLRRRPQYVTMRPGILVDRTYRRTVIGQAFCHSVGWVIVVKASTACGPTSRR